MTWTPSQDAELLALRERGLSFARMAERLRVSRNAVIGRHRRLLGLDTPRGYRPRPGQQRKAPRRIVASRTPFAPDDSCPDFAHDDLHCCAVLSGGGYPVLRA